MPIVLIVLFLWGCSRPDPEELELLKKADPSFSQMVSGKEDAELKIADLKKELAEYKGLFDKKMGELRSAYEKEEARLNSRIREHKAGIDQNRALTRGQLEELDGMMKAKKNQAADLMQAKKEVQDVLQKKGTLSMSPNETQGWENKRNGLQQRIDALSGDIDKLKSEIVLKRKKLRHL